MQTRIILFLLMGQLCAHGAIRCVDVNSTNPAPPYTNWTTAARVIQDAVDAASAGDEIIVTNGIYQTGGRAVHGTMTNRVALTKPISLRSVNGPEATIICGYQVPGTTNGASAVRCVYLTNGAVLSGFTLTNGATRGQGGDYRYDWSAGGVWCESASAVVSNCMLIGNSAIASGGGAWSGTLRSCIIVGNSAGRGGGAAMSTLNNCTLTGNWADTDGGGADSATLNNCAIVGNHCGNVGGGVADGGGIGSLLNNCTVTGNSARYRGGGTHGGTVNNCIVYYNTAPRDENCAGGLSDGYPELPLLNNCWTTPFQSDPQLASSSHLSANSPCRGAGSPIYASGTDIDGELWVNPPSIGCDEVHPGAEAGPLTVVLNANFTNVVPGFGVAFASRIDGYAGANRWEVDGTTIVSNRLGWTTSWLTPGDHSVVLRAYNQSNPGGISATVIVQVVEATHYVSLDSTNPAAPYASWATAASTIQDAVDAASVVGASVLVSNGFYQTGGRAVHGLLTNRVAVTKPINLRSVNGPEVTVIEGRRAPGTPNGYGDGAIRCVYLTSSAIISGFTLTNGATRRDGDDPRQQVGGGVWCESLSALVTNCVLTRNAASRDGGGAIGGKLNNCTLANNTADYGGGAMGGTLDNCFLTANSAETGGGACGSALNNCMVTGNQASTGGGAYGGTLNNCTVTGNSAGYGGGVFGSTLNNCTVTANSAAYGGGVADSDGWWPGLWAGLYNCIVYYNNASVSGSNYWGVPSFNSCCTTPPTCGGGITNAPLFVNLAAGDFRLQSNSTCINAGRNANAPAGLDLSGNPRIVGGTVDIGAYEFQTPQSALSYAWLQQYGFPIDGSADLADPDGDGHNNWQEWRAWTVPTNSTSVLRMLTPLVSSNGLLVRWQSELGQTYFLERSTNLNAVPAFLPLANPVWGQDGITGYVDTNRAGQELWFYRVGVGE
jgi:hypothetical protein